MQTKWEAGGAAPAQWWREALSPRPFLPPAPGVLPLSPPHSPLGPGPGLHLSAHQPRPPEQHTPHGAQCFPPSPSSQPTQVLHPIPPTYPGTRWVPDILQCQQWSLLWSRAPGGWQGPLSWHAAPGARKEVLPDSGAVMGNFTTTIPSREGQGKSDTVGFFSFPLSHCTATAEQSK